MHTSEFQQIILKRKLQAILIGCSIVLLVILLTFIQTSLIWLPCVDGCPLPYDEFVASVGHPPGFSATQVYFDTIFFTLILGITVGGLAIFHLLTHSLRRDIRRWIIKTDEQQYIDAVAAQQLTIGSDGELIAVDTELEPTHHTQRKPIVTHSIVKHMVQVGVKWYLRDVMYGLHIAVIIGCALFVLVWFMGFPTDSWGAVGVELLVLVGLFPGILFGVGLMFRHGKISAHWHKREKSLSAMMRNLQKIIQKRLNDAGLTLEKTHLDALLEAGDLPAEDHAESFNGGWLADNVMNPVYIGDDGGLRHDQA